MGRAPCCDKANVKKGPWSPEEDAKLKDFIHKYGPAANWIALPQKAGLRRCGKSCRLRWLNYLRPNIKHGQFSDHEDALISTLYATIGSRWSVIASQLPGRTDNDIKNYWNTKLKKKIYGLLPSSNNHPRFQPPFSLPHSPSSLSNLSHFYDQARKSLSAAVNSSPLNNLYSNAQVLATQHHNLSGCFYPMKDNMLVFGGNEAPPSCSSSDGSSGQISYGGVKNEEIGFFQGFVENGSSFVLEDPLSSIIDHHHKQRNGVLENSQLQYDLEEVKQLPTSGIGGGGGGGGLFFGDENKGGEMGTYYF